MLALLSFIRYPRELTEDDEVALADVELFENPLQMKDEGIMVEEDPSVDSQLVAASVGVTVSRSATGVLESGEVGGIQLVSAAL